MSPYGITVPLPGPLHDQQALYRELVDLGYTDAWSAEAADNDGLTPLALAAAWAPSCAWERRSCPPTPAALP